VLAGDALGPYVQPERRAPQLEGGLLADLVDELRERDVLVVAALRRLGGGREDRALEALAAAQPLGECQSGDGARLAVLLPARPGEVAADDALDGDHVELLDDQGAAGDIRRYVGADEMGRHDVAELAEPPRRQLREDGALARDRRGEHAIVGRDVVSGQQQELVVGERVQLTDLSGVHEGQGGASARHATSLG
jgi:hypothetical protein